MKGYLQSSSKQQDIPFITIDNEGLTEKIKGKYRYVLCLYDRLINGQKALVTLKNIQVFFNILVPDNKSPDECETKIRDILFGILAVEKLLLKLFKIITSKLHQMIYTHFTISDRFPISALLRDHTLVLTWDIETQSRELGEFAKVLDMNHNVFMIGMILH
ncbi:18274_t:CDS:2 [Funneliformis geosporum]|nr:18274_t:CDS:2 [Funneliformis geosporum]